VKPWRLKFTRRVFYAFMGGLKMIRCLIVFRFLVIAYWFQLILVTFTSSSAVAQPTTFRDGEKAEALIIGDTFSLHSEVLSETRRINVYIPAGYEDSDTLRLPVLYMPDGGIGEDFLHVAGLVQILSMNGTMRPHILVGIENTERRRDLTGPTSVDSDLEIAPHVGGSASFRDFIREELMPFIDESYRTTGETAIVGESLAGLFVVETLLLEPDLFDTYIAIDPSLWWNGGKLVDEAVSLLADRLDHKATLFLATSDEPEIEAATVRLHGLLTAASLPGLTTHLLQLPDEHHWTVYHPAALRAFRLVLAPQPE